LPPHRRRAHDPQVSRTIGCRDEATIGRRQCVRMTSGLTALQHASIIARRLDAASNQLRGTSDDEHIALSVLVIQIYISPMCCA
jgi:hypothetical protein